MSEEKKKKLDWSEQIDFLEDFIERWETAQAEADEEHNKGNTGARDLAQMELNAMTDELGAFCEENELPQWSADEILSQLQEAERVGYFTVPVSEKEFIEKRTAYDVEDNQAFLFNEEGAWITQRGEGKYWALAYNEDELFTDPQAAFKWLLERL